LDDTSGKGHLSRVVGNLCVNAVFVQLPSREEVKVAGSWILQYFRHARLGLGSE